MSLSQPLPPPPSQAFARDRYPTVSSASLSTSVNRQQQYYRGSMTLPPPPSKAFSRDRFQTSSLSTSVNVDRQPDDYFGDSMTVMTSPPRKSYSQNRFSTSSVSMSTNSVSQQQYPRGPIRLPVISRHTIETVPVEVDTPVAVPRVIEIGPSNRAIDFMFKSSSSPIIVRQSHMPSTAPVNEVLRTEEEPTILRHNIVRPVIQEFREVIQPYRKVTRIVHPVQEEVKLIVHTPRRMQKSRPGQSSYSSQSSSTSYMIPSSYSSQSSSSSYSSQGGSPYPVQQRIDDNEISLSSYMSQVPQLRPPSSYSSQSSSQWESSPFYPGQRSESSSLAQSRYPVQQRIDDDDQSFNEAPQQVPAVDSSQPSQVVPTTTPAQPTEPSPSSNLDPTSQPGIPAQELQPTVSTSLDESEQSPTTAAQSSSQSLSQSTSDSASQTSQSEPTTNTEPQPDSNEYLEQQLDSSNEQYTPITQQQQNFK